MSLFLAYDGGGSATRAGLYNAGRELLAEAVGGPCNPVDVGPAQCIAVLRGLARQVMADRRGPVEAVAAAISGAGKSRLQARIGRALARHLGTRVVIATDVRAPLFANAGGRPAVLVVAGTGSCVLAQAGDGRDTVIGGRGVFFGDAGSAYQIGAEALRAAARARDGLAPPTALEARLFEAVGCADEEGVVVWAARAAKADVARLCPVVMAAAAQGDAAARAVVHDQAERLAEQVCAACNRLSLSGNVPVFMVGGVLEHAEAFREAFDEVLRRKAPELRPLLAPLRGHRAALELALTDAPPKWASVCEVAGEPDDGLPTTETGSATAPSLDQMSPAGIVETMNREDARAVKAVAQQAPAVAAAITAAADRLRAGGRLVYVGAGTSGRLGVLDASECPSTFGVAPERVIGIIAGGDRALRESVEGAEDDADQAVKDLRALVPPVSEKDFVTGIAASGSTPYVRAALDAAKTAGACTGLICAVSDPEITADIVIAADTGPEVLVGSTRLKAGTAAKLALNMISTGAMALAGFVYEGHMVGVRPLNAKLRRRAVRILAALAGLDRDAAARALDVAGHSIPVAVLMVQKGLSRADAEERLRKAGGSLRAALETA